MTGIIRRLTGLGRDRRGGTAVEYAFALPIFLAIVLGVVELGRVLFTMHTMHHATADGARYAVVHGSESASPATPSDIEAVVRADALVDQGRLRITVQEVAADGTATTAAAGRIFSPGETVRIVADYEFRFVIPVFDLDAMDLRQFADMVIMN